MHTWHSRASFLLVLVNHFGKTIINCFSSFTSKREPFFDGGYLFVEKYTIKYFSLFFGCFRGKRADLEDGDRRIVHNFGRMHKKKFIFSGFFTKMKKDLDKGGKAW